MIEMEHVVDLRQSVDELREETRVLRDTIDELRELIEWMTRNPEPTAEQWRQARRIFSMPCDPTAPDFHEHVNEVKQQQAAVETPSADEPKGQQDLF